jgi:hypothetical protein
VSGVSELAARAALAGILAVALGGCLLWLRVLPRDLALGVFATSVAILGIFALLGPQAAAIGGALILAAFAVGGVIYGLLALAAHLASR